MGRAEKILEDIGSFKDPLEEALAAYAHDAWSGWLRHMLSFSDDNGKLSQEKVDRWIRQMNTPYSELPEEERESDRREAKAIISVFMNNVDEEEGDG